MTSIPDKIATWQMVQPAIRDKETGETIPGRFELIEIPIPELTAGEVLVEIAGCGVCQTDLSFFYDRIPTVNKPPLTLEHEISGTVVAGETSWLGKEVLIPALMPCGQCSLCETGLDNLCITPRYLEPAPEFMGDFPATFQFRAATSVKLITVKPFPWSIWQQLPIPLPQPFVPPNEHI